MERFRKARAKGPLLYAEFYCEGSDCSARETLVKIKDLDGDLRHALAVGRLGCVLCGGPLKLHWVATFEEWGQREEAEARQSVALQMYRREMAKADAAALFAVPFSVLTDDRLPPIPDGWFDGIGHLKARESL